MWNQKSRALPPKKLGKHPPIFIFTAPSQTRTGSEMCVQTNWRPRASESWERHHGIATFRFAGRPLFPFNCI